MKKREINKTNPIPVKGTIDCDSHNKKDQKKKILEEIGKTGFPLELRVSDYLQNNGYHVANNLYYIDRDEEKGREIDIRALKNFEIDEHGTKLYPVRHCLLIECKKSSSHPWVIFTSELNPYDPQRLKARGDLIKSLNIFMEINEEVNKIHPFNYHIRRGRSYFEAYKKGTDYSIHQALLTSIKATIATTEVEFAAQKNSICYYYPIVIFEGKLYEAFLNAGDINLSEVDSVMMSVFYQSLKYPDEKFTIPILTQKGFTNFLESLHSVLDLLGEMIKAKIKV